ncbi:MAG: polysaccharide deacetylase family protein [Clostridiales bacterium]|nr:polysaccharide deacetylase family protein [Clostridiales bacterium]
MSHMNPQRPRPSSGNPNPKRTMTAQLRALANTTAVMGAIFMVLLVAFVWMVTAINKSPSKDKDSGETSATSSSASAIANITSDPDATTPEATDTTPAQTSEAAHASYPEGTKLIALTFDDGPCEYTPQVLDALERNGVVATFFMIGQNVSGTDAAVLQRMLDLGCELGNHTWSHQILTQVDEEGAYEELRKCDAVIEEKVGQKATVIRPPTGAGLKQEGLFRYSVDNREYVVNWNDSSCPQDWQKPALGDADYTAQYVIDNAIDGDMVLLHDSHKSTVESLDKMIAGLKEKGYVFVTVSQLLEARVGNLTMDEASAKGWDTNKLVQAYDGGPIYGIRYAFSSEKMIFEKKSSS